MKDNIGRLDLETENDDRSITVLTGFDGIIGFDIFIEGKEAAVTNLSVDQARRLRDFLSKWTALYGEPVAPVEDGETQQ